MDSFIVYLKTKIAMQGFTLIRTTSNKLVIFKCFNRYTKCIYVNFLENHIEIKVDKVFDLKGYYPGIERLIISKKLFNNIDDSVNYIQKNIAI